MCNLIKGFKEPRANDFDHYYLEKEEYFGKQCIGKVL